MKTGKIFVFLLLIVLTVTLSACGVSESGKKINALIEKEENFKKDLLAEGLAKKLNETVSAAGGRIVIKEIIFDINFFTVTYEIPKKLSSLNMKIVGAEEDILDNTKKLNAVKERNFDTNPAYYTLSLKHNLKLTDQTVNLEIEINNRKKNVAVFFPGRKIGLLTKKEMFDESGERVTNVNSAAATVSLGINYLQIEYNWPGKKFIVLDLVQQSLLKRTDGVYTSKEAAETFIGIPIQRGDIKLKLLYEDGVILVDY